MKAAVIFNEHARRIRHDPAFLKNLREALGDAGIQSRLFLSGSIPLATRLREIAAGGIDAILIAGGDGTISSGVESCLNCGVPLGIIPAGTHNHFARDLAIPLALRDAVDCIAEGNVARVDVGDVNGLPFINNSSVGAYPRAVEERDELVERFALRKSVAQLLATLRVFARRPVLDAELEVDGQIERCYSPFIFVGNNEYQVRPFEQQFRQALDRGRLCVFTTLERGLGGLFRLIWLSLRGRLEEAARFQARVGQAVSIRLRKRRVRVSKDGEVLRLETPLRYSVRPRALGVFVPKPCAA